MKTFIAILFVTAFMSFTKGQQAIQQLQAELNQKLEVLYSKKKAAYNDCVSKLGDADANCQRIKSSYDNDIEKLKVSYQSRIIQLQQNSENEVQEQSVTNRQLQQNEMATQYEQNYLQYQNKLSQINQQQEQLSSSLLSMANSVNYSIMSNELNRRNKVAGNFVNLNTSYINKIVTAYNKIPESNFSKNLEGNYKAYLLFKRKYSFLNNNTTNTIIPSIVKIKNNQVLEIYPYGKAGFKLNVSNLPLSYGIAESINPNTLDVLTVVLVEPYLLSSVQQETVLESGTGYIVVWTKDKKDAGKSVHIQELNTDSGDIVREVEAKLIYAKSEEDIPNIDNVKIPVNTGNTIYYFGEPTHTPIGVLPLFLKVSKSEQKPLEDGELRLVRIKKYRE